MGQFDQTARPLAKADGAAFFGWALSCCTPAPNLTFLDWDDTRRLVRPGEPDRTNDLVALFRDEGHLDRQTWIVAEIEEEPEPGIFYRMGHYELLLGKEVNPSCDPSGSAVGSLVLNLTGTQNPARLEWAWGAFGTRLAPFVVDVSRQDADSTRAVPRLRKSNDERANSPDSAGWIRSCANAEQPCDSTLERIERGELGLTVLPFLALMDGGGTVDFIDRWKRAVETEPDAARRTHAFQPG